MSEEYLGMYKKFMQHRLMSLVMNRYRDVEDELTQYSFSLHDHLIFSFDVCGGCEAHAILTAMHHGVTGAEGATSRRNAGPMTAEEAVRAAGLLRDLTASQREGNIALKNCPSPTYA
jgi:hypothetical protein